MHPLVRSISSNVNIHNYNIVTLSNIYWVPELVKVRYKREQVFITTTDVPDIIEIEKIDTEKALNSHGLEDYNYRMSELHRAGRMVSYQSIKCTRYTIKKIDVQHDPYLALKSKC